MEERNFISFLYLSRNNFNGDRIEADVTGNGIFEVAAEIRPPDIYNLGN